MTEDADRLLARFREDEAIVAMTSYLRRQRWFAGRGRDVIGLAPVEAVAFRDRPDLALWSVLVRVSYSAGDPDEYHLLLSRRPLAHAVATVEGDVRLVTVAAEEGAPVAVCDALQDPEALAELWEAIRGAEVHQGVGGEARCLNLRMAAEADDPVDGADIHVLAREQSNTSAVRGERELLKCLRRVAPGASAELELTDALARAGFGRIAAPLGAVEYHPAAGGEPTLLAIVQPFLSNGTDGWTLALTSLRTLYAEVEEMSLPGVAAPIGPTAGAGSAGATSAVAVRAVAGAPHEVAETMPEVAGFAAESARLGRTTAEMHLAAMRAGPGPELEPQPVTDAHLDSWAREMLGELDALLATGEAALEPLRARRPRLAAAFDEVRSVRGGTAIRIHGDYHLGQTLRTDEGWTIIDFEGEPNIPLAERRRHSSALRDVAGMLRSFDYAAAAGLAERLEPADAEWQAMEPLGDAWAAANRHAFLAAYSETVADSGLLPTGDGVAVLLRAFELRKAVYETAYELGHRPDWVGIPMRFLLDGGPP
jgi:maltokinase